MPKAAGATDVKRRDDCALPPGPSGYQLLTMGRLQAEPLAYVDELWRQYGDLIRLPVMPGFNIVIAIHPAAMEHVLSTHVERYGKADFFLDAMGAVQGKGLFTSEGDFWRSHRRLMQPAFQQQQIVRLHGVMLSCVQDLIRELEETEGEVIDIAEKMTSLTLKIVSLGLFSVDVSDESDRLRSALLSAIRYVYSRVTSPLAAPLWVPTRQNREFRAAKRAIDEFVLKIIRSRRENLGEQVDLLSMLLSAEDEETGEGLSDVELLNEVITLINAGHETSATALAWTWQLLGTHPEAMARMYSEVDSVLQGGEPSLEKLPQLQYARRVFDESLRLCPPGMGLAPRVAGEDDEIQGYFIPKGSIVNLSTYYTLRHPEFWENPEMFDPDRFLPERAAGRPKHTYIPWGAGPHVCIGKNFALMEVMMVLSAIAQRFEVELVSKQPVEIDPRFTLRPKDGVKVVLKRRN